MKYLLEGYTCILIVLLLLAKLNREGFQTTPDKFDEKIENKTAFVLIKRPDCGYCKAMQPAWDDASTKTRVKGRMIYVDVSDDSAENRAFLNKYNVSSYPTMFGIDKNGNVQPFDDGGGKNRNSVAFVEFANGLA